MNTVYDFEDNTSIACTNVGHDEYGDIEATMVYVEGDQPTDDSVTVCLQRGPDEGNAWGGYFHGAQLAERNGGSDPAALMAFYDSIGARSEELQEDIEKYLRVYLKKSGIKFLPNPERVE